MKKGARLFLLLLVVVFAINAISATLTGHWKFEDTYQDSIGTHSGTAAGGPTFATGKIGKSLSLDGVDDYVNFSSWNIGKIHTVGFWINSTDSDYGVVVGGAANYGTYLEGITTVNKSCYETGVGSVVCAVHGGISGWNHMMVVRDGNLVRFYKNGALVGSQQTLSNNVDLTTSFIGRNNNGFYLKARLDELKIWDHALTTTEITTEYNAGNCADECTTENAKQCSGSGVPQICAPDGDADYCLEWKNLASCSSGFACTNGECTAGSIGYWKFENNYQDSSGNAFHGTGFGNPVFTTGNNGKSVSLDGVDDYMSVPFNSTLRLFNSTIGLWINPSNLSSGTHILASSGGSSYSNGWLIAQVGTYINVYWLSGGVVVQKNILTTNSWQHVLVTKSGSMVSLYHNGVLQGTGTAGTNTYNNVSLLFGGGSSNWYFQGKLDEVKIWSYPLSAGEITNEYNAGAPIVTECADNIDNDGDTKKDALDPDCWTNPSSSATYDASINFEKPHQCSDGIDNDGDGKTDYAVTLDPNNGLTYVYPTNAPLWGYTNNPFELEYQVANISATYGMGYNIYYTYNVGAIARSWYVSPTPPYGGAYYTGTLTKVCNVLGYSTVTGHDCTSAFGSGCGYSSPDDNFMWKFNGNNFVGMSASYKTWISRIWCKHKLSACSDGRDNDHDGKKDSADDGCVGSSDDSEVSQDPDCETSDDYIEGTFPECSDGGDNDEDGVIDKYDSDCWTTAGNPNSYNPSDATEGTAIPQCSDGTDNDGDSKVDCADSDCWSNPTNSSTCDAGDTVEKPAVQCSDGADNDGDGVRDSYDSDCWIDPSDPETYNANDTIESSSLSVTNFFWGDMTGEAINTTGVESSVKLVVVGNNLLGKSISYEIYKDETVDTKVWSGSQSGTTNTEWSYVWEAGKKQSDGSFSQGNYYFKFVANNMSYDSRIVAGNNSPYGLLMVGQESNQVPTATVINPLDKQIYFLNENLDFIATVSDVDDQSVDYRWLLGEGSNMREGSVASGGVIEFNFAYPTTGQKDLLLELDDGRGGVASYKISILVINSSFMLAYVDEPQYNIFLSDREVFFNASSTYAINKTILSNGTAVISCMAGLCPSTTAGCPVGYNTSRCPITIANAPATPAQVNYNGINFTWKFFGPFGYTYECSGTECGRTFSRTFPVAGTYIVQLSTSLNPNSSTSTIFNTHFEDNSAPMCFILNDEDWVNKPAGSYWKYPDSDLISVTNDAGNCYEADGVDGMTREAKQTCCPVGFECQTVSGTKQCVYTGKDDCEDYLTQSECEADSGHSEIARGDLESGNFASCGMENIPYGNAGLCTYGVSCKCAWSDSAPEGERCTAAGTTIYSTFESTPRKWYVSSSNDPDKTAVYNYCDSGEGESPLGGECIVEKTSVVTECGAGIKYKVIQAFVRYSGDNDAERFDCQDKTVEIPCGSIVKLPFFGWWNFAAAALLIAGYYFFMRKK
ncbi:MAG: hypothetical protein RL557_137 [archaeon]